MNASDEINALFNYGYAILESEVRRAINAVRLDPTIGFLHELAGSKEPLVYDMQELFRWLVDLSVIQLLEEKYLRKSDFIVTENYHIRLREKAAKMLIEKTSINFNKVSRLETGRNSSYQTILFNCVQSLANFIAGKRENLQFDIPVKKSERNDSVAVQQKLLNMSSTERQRRGINKSTLWYQKRNIKEGKRIKLYSKTISKVTGH
jgi:CRISPR-associated protein Cas1